MKAAHVWNRSGGDLDSCQTTCEMVWSEDGLSAANHIKAQTNQMKQSQQCNTPLCNNKMHYVPNSKQLFLSELQY